MASITATEKQTCIASNRKLPLPNGKTVLQEWKEAFPDFPDIKERQALAIELMMDYRRKKKPIRLATIARRTGIDYRTLTGWMENSVKFMNALDIINTRLGHSVLSLEVGKLSYDILSSPSTSLAKFRALAEYSGRISPNSLQVNVQTNLVSSIDKATGEVIYQDKSIEAKPEPEPEDLSLPSAESEPEEE